MRQLLPVVCWCGEVACAALAVILSSGRVLQIAVPDTVPDAGVVVRNDGTPERDRILEALRLSGGVIGGPEGAAARMGLRRTTLQSRMKKLNIARHFK